MKRKKLILIPLSLMCALSFTSCRKDTPTGSSSDISESTNSGSSGTKSESTNSGSSSTKPSESSGSSSQSSTHTHTYSKDWSKDENKHWHASTCGDESKADEAEHTYGEPEETADAKTKYTCTVCGYSKEVTSKYSITETEWKELLNTTNNYNVRKEETYDGSTTIQNEYFVENALMIDEVDVSKKILQKDGDQFYSYNFTYGETSWTKQTIREKDFYAYYYNELTTFVNEFSKFSYDLTTKKYCVTTLESDEQAVYTDVSIGFENGKITSCDFTFTNPKIAGYSIKMHYNDFSNTSVEIPTNIHEHTYKTYYTYNDSEHWLEATCGHDAKDKAEHTMVEGVCSVCGYKVPTAGLKYELTEDGSSYVLSGIEDDVTLSGEVVIASYYNGKPVTKINKKVFSNCNLITNFIIPTTITSIGEEAFIWCTGLTSVTIPNSVTEIGYGLFDTCSNLSNVILSENITSIQENTFYDCQKLQSIVIPNSVTSIEYAAFYHCYSLKNIIIPESVKKLEDDAFDKCTDLKSVVIGQNVLIKEDAFFKCSNLMKVYYNGTEEEWNNNISNIQNSIIKDTANKYFYSEEEPTDHTSKAWRYVEGVPTPWFD